MPFAPGQSGNPGGRPKGSAEVRAAAQEHGPAAIARLADLAFDTSISPRANIAAIRELLDRGYGKAPQPITGDGEGGPVVVQLVRFSEGA